MGVRISREPDGRVAIVVVESKTNAAVVSPVEARLLAIKLLLAAEQLTPAKLSE
jgi:hypothetical protein